MHRFVSTSVSCLHINRENKLLTKESKAAKRQLKTQEEDREFLLKQLVSLKKENARLREFFAESMCADTIASSLLIMLIVCDDDTCDSTTVQTAF